MGTKYWHLEDTDQGRLLNVLQCTGQRPFPHQRILQPQTSLVTSVRVSVKHLFRCRTCQSLYWEE